MGTVLPFIYLVGKPVWDELYNFIKAWGIAFGGRLRKLLTVILINPIAFIGYELFGYFVCWYMMYLGYEGETNIGFWTAFTGLALWVPMQLLSLGLHNYRDSCHHQWHTNIIPNY